MFISVGQHEKLAKFLELNPKIDANMALTDDSATFEAYRAVGFGKIGDNVPNMANLGMPKLSASQMWSYATNMMNLSPVDMNNMKAEVPEGVLRLGGTFVIDDDRVVYAWSDSVPGDTPEVDEVLRAVGLNGIDMATAAPEVVEPADDTVEAEPVEAEPVEEESEEAPIDVSAEATDAEVTAEASAEEVSDDEEEEEPLAAEELALGKKKGKKGKKGSRK